MAVLLDLTPLRVSAAYRRLYAGFTLSGIGAQLATVAIGLQVYGITRSTFAVGLVGLWALLPLVVMGLYGGALVDAYDRRTVAVAASLVLWAVSILNTVQAVLGNRHVVLLYLLVAVYNGGFAVVSPARQAIYPRLLDRALLPAANALSTLAMNVALTVGPLMAGLLVSAGGYRFAYGVDALLFTFAVWGLVRLEPIPPEHALVGAQDSSQESGQGSGPGSRPGSGQEDEGSGQGAAEPPRPGLAGVLDGLRFLGTRPNVRMTFLADFCAMILAMPRALFPAVAALAFGGGARTVGLMSAAVAVGSVLAMAFSGPLGGLRRQGLAVVACVAWWGVSIAAFGVCVALGGHALGRGTALWLGCTALASAGAADSVSSVFRQTILQSATPDHLRGRLQGVFVVVVAGGPRLGDLVAGSAATVSSEAVAAMAGGVLCVLAVLSLGAWQRGFLRYDALHPTP